MKVIMLILSVLLLSSCDISKKELSSLNPMESKNSITTQPNETKLNELERSIGLNNKKIEIRKVDFSNQNTIISYPEIINLDNLEQEKKLNKVLKSDALRALDYYGGNEEGNKFNAGFIPKWLGDNFISIQYMGSGFIKEGAYPINIFFTTNLDLKNGKKILLKDVVKIDDKFIDLLRNGKYVPYDPNLEVESEAKEELGKYNDTELISYLNKSDQVSDKNELGVFSYFTKDSLGLSFEVPHAIGDHVEFEIKYSDLKDHILTQNKAWSDILSNSTN